MKNRPRKRDWLQFPELAVAALSSLVDQFEFVVSERTATLVRFETRSVFVNFYPGRLSYEIGIELGRRGHADETTRPYDLAEIMAVTDPDAARKYRRPQASDLESLRHVVRGAADQLMMYAVPALQAQPAFFKRLKQVRAERTKEFGRNLRQAAARARAQELWQRKDYAGVVLALELLDGELTPAEAKKYEYSRKRLSAE